MEIISMTLMPLRTTFGYFVLRKPRNDGDIFVREFGICEHCIDHLEFPFGFSFCTTLLSVLIHVKFVSHKLAPYECGGFIMRHLIVDGFCFTGVCILGRKIFHVSFDDRVSKILVPSKYNKSCKASDVTNLLGRFRAVADLERSSKVFECAVVQGDTCIFTSPIFKVVNGISVSKNVLGAQKNNVLFLGIDHLHLKIKRANYTSVKFRGSKLQRKILKKRNFTNFITNRLQNCSFCKLLNYKRFNETAENSTNKFYIYNEVA